MTLQYETHSVQLVTVPLMAHKIYLAGAHGPIGYYKNLRLFTICCKQFC